MGRLNPSFKQLHAGSKVHSNERFAELIFSEIESDSRCHGLAAYFHCDLYENDSRWAYSIDPLTQPDVSPELISWFPMYFPIHQPIDLKTSVRIGLQSEIIESELLNIKRESHCSSSVKVAFWRLEDATRVWYEWAFLAPIRSQIHNPEGRSYA